MRDFLGCSGNATGKPEDLTVQVGDEVALNNGYFIRPFKTTHVVPSQGYLVCQRKRKLKPDWKNASQKDIISAKKGGVDITDTIEVSPSTKLCLR
jgi:ribonuclease Z